MRFFFKASDDILLQNGSSENTRLFIMKVNGLFVKWLTAADRLSAGDEKAFGDDENEGSFYPIRNTCECTGINTNITLMHIDRRTSSDL